jgi:hypothetical protein
MANAKTQTGRITILPPQLVTIPLKIIGTAPYMQHKFSQKVQAKMLADQMKEGAKTRKRDPRNPKDEFDNAIHYSSEGWIGIPAPAFRAAMISACRLLGFPMTRAKLSVFIEADGFDRDEGTPLVRLIGGEPEMNQSAVRLDSGVASISFRPMWREWGALVRVRFDAEQFSPSDVSNLLWRAGEQVGIGEGRPDSKDSFGMGFGTFRLMTEADELDRPRRKKDRLAIKEKAAAMTRRKGSK